jgi:beta-N-acetylhexosaminidase
VVTALKAALPTLIGAALALAFLPSLGMSLATAAEPAGVRGDASAQAEQTLDRMIGQMILVGFLGSSEKDAGAIAVRDELARGTVGGVLLFPDNIRSPAQLRSLTAFLAAANPELTPFIAVDQEGGLVQRLTRRNGHVYFPSARDVARNKKLNTPEGAFDLYKKMADGLQKSGINLNFGPVVDLNLNPGNTVIGRRKRSYGTDPKLVTTLAGAFISGHRDANIITSAKHFPGHGSSWSDSHKALPDISRSWREIELEPYANLSKAGLLDTVMIGHLYHPRFSDGEKMPASLSSRAVQELRGPIGYRGVIVSDDMEMGAIRGRFPFDEAIVKAVNAGIDILVFSNVKYRDPKLGDKVHAAIAAAARDGRIAPARIEEAYERIVLLKRRMMRHDLANTW